MQRKITPKEKEILQLISDGYSSKDIAKQLGNSSKTIDRMRNNMLLKFNVNNSPHLVAYGIRNKIIE